MHAFQAHPEDKVGEAAKHVGGEGAGGQPARGARQPVIVLRQ